MSTKCTHIHNHHYNHHHRWWPCSFDHFHGAGQGSNGILRGGAACFSAGRGVHPWLTASHHAREKTYQPFRGHFYIQSTSASIMMSWRWYPYNPKWKIEIVYHLPEFWTVMIVARLFHGRDHLADEALRHEENAASRLNFSTVVIIQSSMWNFILWRSFFQSFMGLSREAGGI